VDERRGEGDTVVVRAMKSEKKCKVEHVADGGSETADPLRPERGSESTPHTTYHHLSTGPFPATLGKFRLLPLIPTSDTQRRYDAARVLALRTGEKGSSAPTV